MQYSSLRYSHQNSQAQNKKQRSNSICDTIYANSNQNEKAKEINNRGSKSISKIQHKDICSGIDPKTRILIRISLKFNIKFRKYYYEFFVKLSNLKKKNISLSRITQNSLTKEKFKQALCKLQESMSSAYSKIYSSFYKELSFSRISKQASRNYALQKIAEIGENRYITSKSKEFFKKLSHLDKQWLRVTIFIGVVGNILQDTKHNQLSTKDILSSAFQKIKNGRYNNINKSITKLQKQSTVINQLDKTYTPSKQQSHLYKVQAPLRLLQSQQKFIKTNQIQYKLTKACARTSNCQQQSFKNIFKKQSKPIKLTKTPPNIIRKDPGDFCDNFAIFVDSAAVFGYRQRARSQTNQEANQNDRVKQKNYNRYSNIVYQDYHNSPPQKVQFAGNRTVNPENYTYTSYKDIEIREQQKNREYGPNFHETYTERKQKNSSKSLFQYKKKVMLTNRQFKVIYTSKLAPTKDPVKHQQEIQRTVSSNCLSKTMIPFQHKRQMPIEYSKIEHHNNTINDFRLWSNSNSQLTQLSTQLLTNKNRYLPKKFTNDRQKIAEYKNYLHL